MSNDRKLLKQALEALENYPYYDRHFREKCHPAIAALRAALEQPEQTCNCRWVGDVQTQQCTLHEAHVDAIHEWAERAKAAEAKLEQRCKGIPRRGCNYLAACDTVCSKCGKVHAHHQMVAQFHAAQQPEPEPVAWIQPDHLQKARVAPFLCRVEPTQRCADFVPLYTHPPREWKGLTDEWIDAIWPSPEGTNSIRAVAYAIEQALKEKNK
jgi:hypothetical protein